MCNCCSDTEKRDRTELGIPHCSGKVNKNISVVFSPEELAYVTLLVGKADENEFGITAYDKLYLTVMDKGSASALLAMHDLEDKFPSLNRLAFRNNNL